MPDRSPARGRLRRWVAVAMATVAVLAGSASPAVAARPSGPDQPGPQEQSASQNVTVSISLTVLEPRALTATDTLHLAGLIVNRGTERLTGLEVLIRRGGRLATRSQLARADTRVSSYPLALPAEPVVPADLAVGGAAAFSYDAPVAALSLGDVGVYPLRLEVRGDEGRLGTLDTFLPWFPDPVAAPLRLAWVLPLVDQPRLALPSGAARLAPEPASAPPDATALLDDELATDLAPGGRLAGLLAAAADATAPPAGSRRQPVPVTFALDPALVATAAAMSEGYVVTTPSLDTNAAAPAREAGTGSAAARTWLAGLRAVTSGQPVLSLPYADVDVPALARAGRAEDVRAARRLGDGLLFGATQGGPLLPAARPLTGTVWPPDGQADTADLLALAPVTAGDAPLSALLLDGSAAPVLDPPTFTVSARAEVRTALGRLPALVADAGLGQLVSGAGDPALAADDPATRPGAVRLAEQRFLAETAMIAAEAPALSRAVLIMPPRSWDPGADFAAALLRDAGAVPWLRPATVPQLLDEAPADGVNRAPLAVRSPQLQARALPPAYLGELRAPRSALTTLGDLVVPAAPNGADRLAPQRAALLRLESLAWRDPLLLPLAQQQARALTARLKGYLDRVTVLTGGSVTLTSTTGVLPVTVQNGLGVDVAVRLAVETRNRAAVLTDLTAPMVVRAGARETRRIELSARSTGRFPVDVDLRTATGNQLLRPGPQVAVDVTAYGRLALALTGGALAVLLVAAGVRLIRRLQRRTRGEPHPRRERHPDVGLGVPR